MIKFNDTIICYFMRDELLSKVINEKILSLDILSSKNISHKTLLTSLNTNNKKFTLKL